MRLPLSVTVPQPCAQNWAAMAPVDTGRHCAVCKKTVVDFSRQTTEEIVAYLARPGQEQACGRFRAGHIIQPPMRLLNWRAAPWLAASLVAVLTLTHCAADTSSVSPVEKNNAGAQDGQLVRGQVLDRDSRQPLAGALIICEADTQCQARTKADGSFALVLPSRLAGSKLIAALAEKQSLLQEQPGDDVRMPYVPHYFTAGNDVTVLLRRPPMIVGQTKLEPGETYTSAIRQYLVHCGAVPPPPVLTTIKFTPPHPTHGHR